MKPNELHFISAKTMLKDAMPPQLPPLFWKANAHDFAITAQSINIITSDSASKSAQITARIATEVAMKKLPLAPTRGINPFTNANESEDYDRMIASEQENTGVLYVNTFLTEALLEREMIDALPKMLRWLWLERDSGTRFPYEALNLHIANVSTGTMMKDEHRGNMIQFIKQNKISLVVINSFEFACRTQREKDDLVVMIKTLRETCGVAVVVCTHENADRLRSSTRGPLATLAMLADFVEPVSDIAPDITARKVEYCMPIAVTTTDNEKPAAPIYFNADDMIAKLKNASTEGLLDDITVEELATL